ncbi:SET domain-containing protein SmydA-8 [Teleopsis dalmanni]|uniref:SET domain-containing protein SmydA-8 n=1 Tax=Teleopsis dalmanni TaxID=139649 RepID=UPI0018CD261C|nr:SET domain-containing protein SmydA-8 [Teleopsis dalmanni]
MKNLSCAVCGKKSSQTCSNCKNIYYCSREHQVAHWKEVHKKECKCYEVAINDLLGRHLRAKRNIKPGEIILRESPLIYGPKISCAPTCLGCHKLLPDPKPPQKNYYKCSKCTWPLCSKACEISPNHVDECQLMSARKFESKLNYNSANLNSTTMVPAYCIIMPLRCILLKNKSAELFDKFAELEHHLPERIGTPLYNVLRANLITFMHRIMGLHEWSETEILRIAGRIDTNAFDVRQESNAIRVRAIYPAAAMISHDCISNARHTFDDNMQIVFIAKTAIAKGEIIATSYTQPLKCTLLRRIHLAQAKCFACTCQRCADPLELNTFAGSFVCKKCKIGKFISTNPYDNDAKWTCQICQDPKTAMQILKGYEALQKEIDGCNKTSITQFEDFIYKHRADLHEKNTYVLQVKYALTQLYGKALTSASDPSEIDESHISRQIELCRELLDLADLLDGGWSIFRGNLLLDLQWALFIAVKKNLLNRDRNLKESKLLLDEAKEIMKLEPGMQEKLKNREESLQNLQF